MANARNIFGERPNQAPYNSQLGRLAYQDSLVASEAVHVPISVTGTAPVLDIRRGNFFDNGTLTATTSPTFTNVPKNAKWSYSFNSGEGGAGFYIPDDIEPLQTVNRPSAFDSTSIRQTRFKPDGTKVYFLAVSLGGVSDVIAQHALSTAWDLSTIVATAEATFSVAGQESVPYDFVFSPDGTKLSVVGTSGDGIDYYTLSTEWLISSASHQSYFDLNNNLAALCYNQDGTILHICDSFERLHKYTLSTPYVATSANMTFVSASYITGTGALPADSFVKQFAFSPDGKTILSTGQTHDRLQKHALYEAYTVNTNARGGIDTGIPLSRLINNDIVSTMGVSEDFKYMWLGAQDSGTAPGDKRMVLFNIASATPVTLPASVVEGSPTLIKPNARTTMDFVTSDGGATVNLIDVRVV